MHVVYSYTEGTGKREHAGWYLREIHNRRLTAGTDSKGIFSPGEELFLPHLQT